MSIKDILQRMKTYEPKPCNRNKYNGDRKVAIYLDYLNGMKQNDIAIKYNISNCRVHQIIASVNYIINKYVKKSIKNV